jgi:hypothetical protein
MIGRIIAFVLGNFTLNLVSGDLFTASPSSGLAPLTVGFYVPPTAGPGYSIVTGDGTTIQEEHGNAACPPNSLCNNTYTYASPGTYTAKLMAVPEPEPPCDTMGCINLNHSGPGASWPELQPENMGTVTITVR